MLAFALPAVWALTGLSVVGALSRISSGLGSFSLLAENWKLKKMVDLGIPKEMIHPPERDEEEEALREMSRMMRAQQGESTILDDEFRPFVIQIDHEEEDIAGKYAFICVDEYRLFVDSLRHYDLMRGQGHLFHKVEEVVYGTTFEARDLRFLWDDYVLLVGKQKRLTRVRLADAEFRKLAGIDGTI